jgi:NAD(P)-dependent dehydrogenase (short-subunit alcohol dehydrogenase family)
MPSVLVTGAARGFGRALVDTYGRRGWTLFPLVRTRADAEDLAAENCHPIVGDVGTAGVDVAIASVLRTHVTALDLLINNAGHVKKLRWLPETSESDIEELVRVHCVGVFRCTRAALPFLRQAANATIINVSSRFGSVTRMAGEEFRGIYSYSIAKGALNMLTACLDRELRSEGIRVFAVHPGRLRTAAGAMDADTDPAVAAERLADWAASLPRDAECALYDVMEGGVIPW